MCGRNTFNTSDMVICRVRCSSYLAVFRLCQTGLVILGGRAELGVFDGAEPGQAGVCLGPVREAASSAAWQNRVGGSHQYEKLAV